MSIIGALSISTQGMKSQATALGVIGTNVANVQSGGYKRADPFFQTLTGKRTFEQSDINANRPIITNRIDLQGTISGTSNAMDTAISGDGFFITRTTFDNSGETFYTRDGSFEQFALNDISVTDPVTGSSYLTKDSYLVDKNGNFLLGYAARADGTFPTSGRPAPMRVDQNAFSNTGRATTVVDLAYALNSNATAITGTHLNAVSTFESSGVRPAGMEVFPIDIVDSAGIMQSARINLTKASASQWDMSLTYQDVPVAQVDTLSIAGTVEAGDTYSATINGATATYEAITGDTIASVTTFLTNKINLTDAISQDVLATVGAGGTITLTAKSPGSTFSASASSLDGGGTPDNTATSVNTTPNFTGMTTLAPTTAINFNGSGEVVTPTAPISFSFTYPASTAGGASTTAAFTMDISDFSQFNTPSRRERYSQNGIESAPISSIGFDNVGHVIGYFSTGNSVPLYQVPLANFANPNGLETHNGMTFKETEFSGKPDIETVGASGRASFISHAVEVSNVSLVDEFTAMIKTQRAYSSSAKAFQTVDEMLATASQMKR